MPINMDRRSNDCIRRQHVVEAALEGRRRKGGNKAARRRKEGGNMKTAERRHYGVQKAVEKSKHIAMGLSIYSACIRQVDSGCKKLR